MKNLSVADLLRLWAMCNRALKDRGVIHTRNMVGEIAEAVAHSYLGGIRGSFSQAGWDVRTSDGLRVQVKGIWRTADTKRANTSALRGQDYDSVLVIEFDEYFESATALHMQRSLVEELFPVRPHVNGRIIRLTKVLREHPDVLEMDLSGYLGKI